MDAYCQEFFDPNDPIDRPNIENIIDWVVTRDERTRQENAELAGRLLAGSISPQTEPGAPSDDPHGDTESDAASEVEIESEFPTELLNPPGVLKDFMDWNLECAPKPQPILALVSSLSIVATALARKVKTQTGLRTNLYLVSVAGTAAGKDHGRKCLKEALTHAGMDDLVGGEEFASGKGVLAAAQRQPASVFQIDEFGLMLRAIRSRNAGTHLQEIITILMKLFSSAGSVYKGTEYADQKTRPKIDIEFPCINLHATTTPEPLFESFGSADVTSGYINRLLIVFAPDVRIARRLVDIDPPKDHLLEWLRVARDLRQGQFAGFMPNNPITIPMTAAAEQLFSELADFEIQQIRSKETCGLHHLWVRCWEHASKLALVVACAKHSDPQQFSALIEQRKVFVDEESARWAIAFVKHTISRMEIEVAARVADSEFGRLVQLVHRTILMAGPKGLTERELSRKCASFKGLPPRQRDEVTGALTRSEEIAQVDFVAPSGKGRGRKAWVATSPAAEDQWQ